MGETIDIQNKEPTREERKRELKKQADVHGARANEFHRQYLELLVAKKEGQALEQAKIEEVLKNLPSDISAQAAREKILQMPLSSSERQLDTNIDRVRESEKHETLEQRRLLGEIKKIDQEIFNKKVDAHTKKVFKKFEYFLDSFKYTRSMFYSLADDIQEGYDLEQDFFRRGEKLGLNRSIMFSIQHHIRHGEKVYLMDVLEKIMNIPDAYGEALLEKDFFAGSWPDDHRSGFFANL